MIGKAEKMVVDLALLACLMNDKETSNMKSTVQHVSLKNCNLFHLSMQCC